MRDPTGPLRRAADGLGRTVVPVRHDVDVDVSSSDRVAAMRDRVVVRQGPPAATMTPAVREVDDVDVSVHHVAGRPIAVYYRWIASARWTPGAHPPDHR